MRARYFRRSRSLHALLALGLVAAAWSARTAFAPRFDHPKHAKLFPTCTTCHEGAATEGAPFFPTAASCASCHDGTVEEKVEYAVPAPRPSTLRFQHVRHTEHAATPPPGRERVKDCAACHGERGRPRMEIHRTAPAQCLACHALPATHFAVPDSACATCHVPLAEAKTLPRDRIAAFEAPPNHQAPGFMATGQTSHGALATPVVGRIAASCATCHAREYCMSCHVDAPEQRTIQALASDPRSLAIPADLKAPTSHAPAGFATAHGADARRNTATCATCHTRESCLSCHVEPLPREVRAQHAAAPARGTGATVARTRPASHTITFAKTHGPDASAAPTTCTTCHTRESCLSCHRPDAATSQAMAGDFHPAGFLARHPTEAYRRETSCADCHQVGQFCANCHQQVGVTAKGPLGNAKYHDAKTSFIVGHGDAARRSLESCVTCHTERDCTVCHSALGGRRFNPHGPGFDAQRLKRKNPEMCTVCHGAAIP